MRILIFHGYLLRGTGSNVYNASLVRTLLDLGHEVHLLCQDRDAGSLPFVDAVGRFDGDRLAVEAIREPVLCTAYLPECLPLMFPIAPGIGIIVGTPGAPANGETPTYAHLSPFSLASSVSYHPP